MTTTGKKVFVGMSGGVDSSVAALRLKNQGYNVIGVFIKVWHPDFMVCNWEQERLDAMRVAAHLQIPFMTCDAESAYKNAVADYFISEYQAGRTPNPDVMCNKEVKFGAFLQFAKSHGADHIATGHYAQKRVAEQSELHRGKDTNKDQSYFLWSLTQEQLDYSLFPIGDSEKEEIRKEASAAKLPVADKKDSQGICFLGHVDIPEFLSHYIPLSPGVVLNKEGEEIGQHKGAFVYTVGQRHGFSLTNGTTSQKPHYVIDKDVSNNTITVDSTKSLIEKTQRIVLSNVQLRSEIESGESLEVQFRYRQNPIPVNVEANDTTLIIDIQNVVEKPSPGQSCVLYRGSHCLGGGIIE